MRTLALDGSMGGSGDMLVAALLDAGADRSALAPVEAALDLAYDVREVRRQGVAAGRVVVTRDGEPLEGAGDGRTLEDIRARTDAIDLSAPVAADARAVFERLAAAEAAVHGGDPAETHVHEVGADDAVADVVGACLLLADIEVESVVVTPLAAGGGEVTFEHGTYPVPAPAVVELAAGADWELRGGPVDRELLTPTGAALLAHHATGVEHLPPMAVEATGYGAGAADVPDRPNVLRALLGETRGPLPTDDVVLLETNLDDATPEVLGALQERLADVGARDVSVVPLTMKKSRPGHLVRVVARPADAGRVARRLAAETGTLGVRQVGATHRWVADRRLETVAVALDGEEHEVAVKVATDADGAVVDVSAEYDDALAVARETGEPVREVMRLAEARLRDRD